MDATLKGIRRCKGDETRQAILVLPLMLLKIFERLMLNPRHTALRAVVLCSFHASLCKCHVTDSELMLRRRSFKMYDWGMIIVVRRSKTIQFRERKLEIPVTRCPDRRLCAVFCGS